MNSRNRTLNRADALFWGIQRLNSAELILKEKSWDMRQIWKPALSFCRWRNSGFCHCVAFVVWVFLCVLRTNLFGFAVRLWKCRRQLSGQTRATKWTSPLAARLPTPSPGLHSAGCVWSGHLKADQSHPLVMSQVTECGLHLLDRVSATPRTASPVVIVLL